MAEPTTVPAAAPETAAAPVLPPAAAAAPVPLTAESPAAAAPSPPVAAPPVVSHETPKPESSEVKQVEPAKVTDGEKPAVVAEKSLLGEQIQKPAEGEKPPVETKPEIKPEPAKIEPLKYEAFKLPDGMTLNADDVGKYTAILGEHQVPQEAAQQLVDLYISERQRDTQLQRETWQRTRDDWVSEVKKDPEIGGARLQTTLQRCQDVLNQYAHAAGAERADKLKLALGFTGAGDNPELIRFVNWAARFTVEGSKPLAAPPSNKPLPMSRAQRRYANPAFSTGA